MSNNSEEEFLKALKNENSKAIRNLYDKFYLMIDRMVLKNGGQSADAEDVFQESVVVLIKNIQNKEFILTAKISTYFYAIAKNIWRKNMRTSSKEYSVEIDDRMLGVNESEIPLDNTEFKFALMNKVFTEISEDCQKVLNLFYYKKKKLSEIATILGYSEAFAKQKKFRCLAGFKKKVMMQGGDRL